MTGNFREQYDRDRDLRGKPFGATCYAPFGSLYFGPLGYVGFCCHNQMQHAAIGHISEQRLDELWNGEKAQSVRRAVAKYAFPKPTCEFCGWQAKAGNLDANFAKKYDILKVGEEAWTWPTRMEFAMSNVCNFMCTMCDGNHSSLIRSKLEKRPPLPKFYDDQFFADLERYLPHLDHAAFLGGEPFLADENYRVWDMLVALGLKDKVSLKVTTNGSVFSSKMRKVIEQLPFNVIVSLEGVSKDTQDAIRVGSDLDVVMPNIERFREYTRERGTNLTFAHCLMVQNWFGFADLLSFAEERGVRVFVNSVVSPHSHSLYRLPADELEPIVLELERQRDELAPRLEKNRNTLVNTVQALRNFLDSLRDGTEVRYQPAHHASKARLKLEAAWKLSGLGKIEEALTVVDEIRPEDPAYYFALVAKANFKRRSGLADESRELLEAAIALDGTRPQGYVERAWLMLDRDRIEDGIAACADAGERDPNGQLEAQICDVLGFLQVRKGEHEDAIAKFDRVVELQPTEARPYIHRAWTRLETGDRELARQDLEKALELAPENEEARNLLARTRAS